MTNSVQPNFVLDEEESRLRFPGRALQDDDTRLLTDYESYDLETGAVAIKRSYTDNIKRKLEKMVRHPLFLIFFLGFILFLIVLFSVGGFDVSEPHPIKKPGENDTVRNPQPKDGRLRFNFEESQRFSLNPGATSDIRFVTNDNVKDGSYVDADLNYIVLKHVEDGTERVLANRKTISMDGRPLQFKDYYCSHDLNFLMVTTDYERGWRHSFFANYYVFSTSINKTVGLVQSQSDKFIPGESGSGRISLAIWAPEGNHVAWVRDNDLYVSTFSLKGNEINIKETRLTIDGSKDTINGIADWVYEEEILASHAAMWFSPDGSKLAYFKFNESMVPEYDYPLYEGRPYPRQISIKYPKPGFPNPSVSLHVASHQDIQQNATSDFLVEFKQGDLFLPVDLLLVEVKWLNRNDTLLVRAMNRVQDYQKVFLVSFSSMEGTWRAKLVRDEPAADHSWYNVLQPVTVVPPSDQYSASYLELMEDAAGYQHIAYFKDIESAQPSSWLTTGEFEVTEISSVDPSDNRANPLVYYMSTEGSSMERHLYSIRSNAYNKTKLTPPKNIQFTRLLPKLNYTIEQISSDIPVNLTVSNQTDPAVGVHGYYSVIFSPRSQYYMLNYLGPDVPFSKLVHTATSWEKTYSSSDFVRKKILEYKLSPVEYFNIKNEANQDMNMRLTFPPEFDISGKVKYPVLFYVYGGPGSQTVSQIYHMDFSKAIADAGFIVASVDGRGTGYKGRKYRSVVSKQLGKYEVIDQITAAKWLSKKPYVDPTRIAIWGWSYGGYMTAKCLEADSGVFSLGMSVAPVTDWRFYDSVYTERYMKTPDVNQDGYFKSAVQDVEAFKKVHYLVIHGTADDNVHFQNSADLVAKLTGHHVRTYRLQFYPDNNHNLGEASTENYYTLRTFLFTNFKAADNGVTTK